MAGDYRRPEGGEGGGEGGRPVQRVAVAHLGRLPFFHQVAHERDPAAVDQDVAVGVPPPVVGRLHPPAPYVDGGQGFEGASGRGDLHPVDLGEAVFGHPQAGVVPVLAGAVEQHPPAGAVPPDGGAREGRVAEHVVPMPVGVDDPPHRLGGEGAELASQLGSRFMALPRVDEQHPVVSDRNPDVQPQKREPAPEDALGQFLEHRPPFYASGRRRPAPARRPFRGGFAPDGPPSGIM